MTNITNDELIKLSLGFWGEDYAEAPVQQLAKELISARAEIARLRAEIEQQKYMIDLFTTRHEGLVADIVREIAEKLKTGEKA